MIYIPANNNLCGTMTGRAGAPTPPDAASPASRVGAAIARAGRRPRRRSAGVERRHRREGLDASPIEERRTGARCWPPPAASCSPAAPPTARSTPSTRRPASCCGSVRSSSGIVAPPTTFTRRRQAVPRGARRLGRRPARDAEQAQPRVPRRVPAGARGRLYFSICARLAAAGRQRRRSRVPAQARPTAPAPAVPGSTSA